MLKVEGSKVQGSGGSSTGDMTEGDQGSGNRGGRTRRREGERVRVGQDSQGEMVAKKVILEA